MRALDKMDAKKSLGSWDGVFKAYKLYEQCDDGIYAETFSDSTVHLLAAKWSQIDRLNALTARDKGFHNFVMRHINSTGGMDELKKVAEQAKNKCSARLTKLCGQIESAANAALTENQ